VRRRFFGPGLLAFYLLPAWRRRRDADLYAVALMWDDLKMDAPVLVAKGADLIAKHIRALAEEHDVPILENPPLARTLYAKVELDSPVPPDLYAAVAQVIAFVYKLKNKTIA